MLQNEGRNFWAEIKRMKASSAFVSKSVDGISDLRTYGDCLLINIVICIRLLIMITMRCSALGLTSIRCLAVTLIALNMFLFMM